MNTNFQPNWASAPGVTISRILRERSVSVDEFTKQMECSDQHVADLLKGQRAIDKKIANQLVLVLGASIDFWIKRERIYRESLERLLIEEQEKIGIQWLKEIPIADMKKFGWVDVSKNLQDRLRKCLEYFGVSSVNEWQIKYGDPVNLAAFRTTSAFEPNIGAVSAWIRRGEILSQEIDCKSWDAALFKENLFKIKELTREKNPEIFLPKLRKLCSDCGVALVIVRTPSGCMASGATKFLSPHKALMLLSFRYLSDDQFWFTFFHEAGHLLLHGKRAFFIEEKGKNKNTIQEEIEANQFAGDILINGRYKDELKNLSLDKWSIVKFSKKVGVSPGIVIGQLQYYGYIDFNRLNSFKRRYNWDQISTSSSL